MWAETMRIHKENIQNFPRFTLCSEPFFTDKTCFIAIAEKYPFYILGFLNSAIGRYSLKRNVSILDDGGYLMQKIFLEKIVLPIFEDRSMQMIEGLVQQSLVKETQEIRKAVDNSFHQLLGLTIQEISYIEKDNTQLLIRG